ncbi:MAG: hypothetical protein ABI461_02390 [Polyangiaceae bacterium]
MTHTVSVTAFSFFACVALAVACGGGRDVVPETHDVRGDTKPAAQNGGYDYVARRPLGTVGLAEARGIAPDVAARAVDSVADALDACERDLRSQNRFVPGAIRIVAEVDDRGAVEGVNVKMSDDKGAAANAILCLVAPVRLLTFPPNPGDAGARGIAIEASWGPE